VVELADDGNEDHRAQASWHATVAATEAATAAEYDESDLKFTWAGPSVRVATAGDGRGFAAIVRGIPGGSYYGIAREPEPEELNR
jgi:hypothetical protein